jgi:hypothetical protein
MNHRLRTSFIAAAIVGSATLLGGCAQRPPASSDAGPPKELGERAVFETTTTTALSDSTPDTSAGETTTTATAVAHPSTTTTARAGGVAATATTVPAKPLGGSVTDGQGDNGVGAPHYADVAAVSLEDRGSELRTTVTFAAGIPRTLASGEVMGVGVDLFRTNERESDYQLFATGRADGWTAYLDTPDGFVKYPGAFTVSGATLAFTVPWSSVGGHTAAKYSTFADWSKAAVAVVAQSGQDSAPDQGTAPLA